MNTSLSILGRQPALGRAELESLYGGDNQKPVGDYASVVLKSYESIDFERLGGTIKLGEVLTVLPYADWSAIVKEIVRSFNQLLSLPSGVKLQLGLSVYGFETSVYEVNNTAIKIKKALKSHGQSVRVVPNKELSLNSAQVLHNNLVGERGFELLIVKNNKGTILARTRKVQDIDSYTQRDRGRPKRDARIGMLPPKLAQIIINLANPLKQSTILDPFCGTGVILQEAALMSLSPYGTDIETRMIEYSETNLLWLKANTGLPSMMELEIGDATTHKWQTFTGVATETYLGQPFTSMPPDEVLQKTVQTCNLIITRFLENIAKQVSSKTRLSLAVPAWKKADNTSFIHLRILDQLESLGYNRVSFVHARNSDLVYYRPGQIVGRELVVLQRI